MVTESNHESDVTRPYESGSSSTSSEDSVPQMPAEDMERMRDFLTSIGLLEHRQRAIRESTLRRWDRFDGHIIYGVTRGCAHRMNRNSENPRNKLSFILYDAMVEETGEDRILKFANPLVLAARPELEDLIQNEHAVIASMDHPNIVKTHGLLKKGIMSYLVLEYLPFTVAEVIGPKPELKGVAFFASEAGKAVQHLHSKDIVHGDIKPAQFMGGRMPGNPEYRVLKLLDFTGALHPELPAPPRMPYTPGYAAPEVMAATSTKDLAEKAKAFTHKADIYSLGITYAKVALGSAAEPEEISLVFSEPKHTRERALEAMFKHHLPYRFAALIEHMTSENPSERPDIEQVIPHTEEFSMINGAKDNIEISKDLYSGKVSGIKKIRAF